MQVVSTATSGGQDTAVFQNLGSTQGFTNAASGVTIPSGAWIEVIQQAVASLTDATTDAAAFSLINSPTGKIKLIKIPSWLQPSDTGTEVQINAAAPAGIGDMKVAVYDALTATPLATPGSQVDQARVVVTPAESFLRNFIDNSRFRVIQRGASFATAAGFQIDRWQTSQTGAGVLSLAQTSYTSSSLPGGNYANGAAFYSAKLTVTTPSTPAASDFYVFQHALDQADSAEICNGNISANLWGWWVLRFYVKASITGTLGVSVYLNGIGDRITHDVPIAAANTWYEVIWVMSARAGNYGASGNPPATAGITLRFCLGAGANNRFAPSSLDTWGGGAAFYASTSSTDFIATAGATLEITDVTLNGGRQPLVKSTRHYDEDLRRCQRMYCKGYPIGLQAGAASAGAGCGFFYATNTTQAYGNIRFPVDMIGVPTVRLFDPTNGGVAGTVNLNQATASGFSAGNISEKGFNVVNGSGLAGGNTLLAQWDASKEI